MNFYCWKNNAVDAFDRIRRRKSYFSAELVSHICELWTWQYAVCCMHMHTNFHLYRGWNAFYFVFLFACTAVKLFCCFFGEFSLSLSTVTKMAPYLMCLWTNRYEVMEFREKNRIPYWSNIFPVICEEKAATYLLALLFLLLLSYCRRLSLFLA